MLNLLPQPMLALDAELIVYAVGAVIVVGSWIANWLKNQHQTRQKEQAQGGGREAAEGRNVDELAARRRAELQQEARRRRAAAQRQGGSPGGGAEPSNLTMAERIERARAQEAYRRRTEELRRSGETQSAEQRPSPAPSRSGEAEHDREMAQRRRREEAEAQEKERRRRQLEGARQERDQAEQERRRRVEAARRVQQTQQQSQQRTGSRSQQPQRPAPQHRPQPSAVRQPAVITDAMIGDISDTEIGSKPTRRERGAEAHTPIAVGSSAGLVRGRDLGILLSSTSTLKQAIIFKEVFDRPLALRDQQTQPF